MSRRSPRPYPGSRPVCPWCKNFYDPEFDDCPWRYGSEITSEYSFPYGYIACPSGLNDALVKAQRSDLLSHVNYIPIKLWDDYFVDWLTEPALKEIAFKEYLNLILPPTVGSDRKNPPLPKRSRRAK